MDSTHLDTLDQQILEEKKLVAREHFLNAWEAGILDGIDSEIVAREMVIGALEQVCFSQGQQGIDALLKEISEMDLKGEFLPQKTLN